MRKQLAYVKAYKSFVSGPGRVSYTKKSQFHKKQQSDYDEEKEREKRKEGARDIMAVVGKGSSPLVLVDGYNLMFKSKRYSKKMGKNPGEARDKLEGDIKELCVMKGWRGVVVWDGAGYQGEKEYDGEVGIR